MNIIECRFSHGYVYVTLGEFPELSDDVPAAVVSCTFKSNGKIIHAEDAIVWYFKMLQVQGDRADYRIDQPSFMLSFPAEESDVGSELELSCSLWMCKKVAYYEVLKNPPFSGEKALINESIILTTGEEAAFSGSLAAMKVGTKTEFLLDVKMECSVSGLSWLSELELRGAKPFYQPRFGDLGVSNFEFSMSDVKKSDLKDAMLLVRLTGVKAEDDVTEAVTFMVPVDCS